VVSIQERLSLVNGEAMLESANRCATRVRARALLWQMLAGTVFRKNSSEVLDGVGR
jgi:hypothetical protein